MAEYLVIRVGAEPGSLASWIAVDGNGSRRSPPMTGQLAEAARDVRDRSVIVLVPASAVSTLTIDLPARGARLLAALPYALEDQVADDVDKLHFAPGKRLASGRIPVAVVAREQMDEWLGRLSAAGIRASRIVPENHGLAYVPNTMSMLVADDELWFNDGVEVEFCLQGVRPADALAAAGVLDERNEAGGDAARSRNLLVYSDAEANSRYEHDWNVLRNELDSLDVNLLRDGLLPRIAVTVASGTGINLMQGRYGERTELKVVFAPWRLAAMLIGVVMALGVVAKGVDFYRLDSERDSLREAFTSEYRKLRPGDTREILDPVGTIDSLRRELVTGSTAPPVFLPLLQQLAAALGQTPGTAIQAISYRAGVVDVRLSAPDVATLDRVRAALSEDGRYAASIESTTQVGDAVDSRMRIREAGS